MVEKENKKKRKRDGAKACCTNFHTYNNIAYFFLSSPLYNSLNASITTTCELPIFICNFGVFV